jgi:hypothetical protein
VFIDSKVDVTVVGYLLSYTVIGFEEGREWGRGLSVNSNNPIIWYRIMSF